MMADKPETTAVGFIDMTPTWVGILPLLLAAIESGTETGRSAARAELKRMAQIADQAVAESKLKGE